VRIAYVAKHGSGDNDDEGAVLDALRQLGHTVECFKEDHGVPQSFPHDFVLCHKWERFDLMQHVKAPIVFWFFDLISSDDWNLTARSAERSAWLERMTARCSIGFLTDGDAVERSRTTSRKLHWLMQGADQRVLGRGDPTVKVRTQNRHGVQAPTSGDILFCGSIIHGGRRIEWVEDMRRVWGPRFVEIGHHPHHRVHGRELANLMANFKILACPDGPVTDRYWSNRVYQAGGFGACVVHPRCQLLLPHYREGLEMTFFKDRNEQHSRIKWLLEKDIVREIIQTNVLQRTARDHTYLHRVRDLIQKVQEVLHV
jgi:hypothetical protein